MNERGKETQLKNYFIMIVGREREGTRADRMKGSERGSGWGVGSVLIFCNQCLFFLF